MYILALRAGSEPSLRSAPSSAKRTKPACAVAAIADANSLVEVELDQPQIKPNDLLVRVKAVSVNPADAKIRIRSAKDPQPEARILGYDAVGIVEEIGDAVEGFKTGDRVWYAGDVTRKGSNAELQAVDARIVSHVAEFLEKHPNIELKLSLSDNIVDIVEMGFDLAIRVGSLTSSTLLARKLAENPRILVASPEYLKKHGVPQLPQDLSAHKCVVLGETKVWHLGDKSGRIEDIKVSGPFTTNLGDAVTETIIDGLGIGMKSIWDVREQVAKGELEPKYYNLKTYVGFAMDAPPSVSAKAKVRLEPNVTDAAPRTNGRSAANFLALPTQRF